MTYTQIVTPTPGIPCKPGWCLQYVRQTFGAPVVEPTASAGWANAQYKHAGKDFPAGCYVPVWFSLEQEPAGHVALMCPDGSVYSTSDDTTTPHHHPSLDDLIAYYWRNPLSYLGWSEDISGVRVVINAMVTVESVSTTDSTTTRTEDDDMSKLVLATDGVSPQVWCGDGIWRRPVWTVDTMTNQQWLAQNKVLGPFYNDGVVQTIPDLNSIGVDMMALVGKDVNGR